MENILQAFIKNAERLRDKSCFRYRVGGRWKDVSWNEAEERIYSIARGLLALKIKKGDKIAILSKTRLEWTLCDLAILSIGAVTVPIYHSNTAEQAAHIIEQSDAMPVIVENLAQMAKIEQRVELLPNFQRIIVMVGETKKNRRITLDDVERRGNLEGVLSLDEWRKGIDAIHANDLASLVYTSEATGNSKGVILTHRNFIAASEAFCRLVSMATEDVGLLFLPLAHILGRVIQFCQIYQGFTHAYAEDMDKLMDTMGQIRPHFFAGAPRIFEQVYEKVHSQVQAGSSLKKAVSGWAVSVGQEVSKKLQTKQKIGLMLSLRHRLANLLFLNKMKKHLGGRLRYAISGGAPLSREITDFLYAAGILVLEGDCLTKTTGANNAEIFQIGGLS